MFLFRNTANCWEALGGSTENFWLISFTVSSPSRNASKMEMRSGCASALKKSALKLLSCCLIRASRLITGASQRICESMQLLTPARDNCQELNEHKKSNLEAE